MRLYRLTKAKHASNAFAGVGALRYPGRWHRKGTPVVYASDGPASALLEVLVHTEAHRLLDDDFVLFTVDLDPARHLVRLEAQGLPAGWRARHWPDATQAVGTAWAEKLVSVVLDVPSAIVPYQRNYLINPQHPAFGELDIAGPDAFEIDPRLMPGGG